MDSLTPRVVMLLISGLLNIALLYLVAYLMDTNAKLRTILGAKNDKN